MSDPTDAAKPGAADQPTRFQRVARHGCAGLAYTVVLLPVVVAIWFFSSIPRGGEMLGDLATDLLWWPGADTEIVVLNDSGHDVARFVIRYAGQEIRYNSLLQARRDGDPNQNISHYKKMFFRDIKSRTFPIEITYTEVETGVTRSGSSVADRWPRGECRFVIVLQPDGAQFSECRRPEREDFNVSQ